MTAGDFYIIRQLCVPEFYSQDPENNLEKLISIGERLA